MEQMEVQYSSVLGWENIYVIAPNKSIFKRATQKWVLDKLKDYDVVAIDTETQGDFDHIHCQKVVMLQIGTVDFQIVIDTRYVDPTSILECLSRKLVIGHNIKYDYEVIKLNYGISLNKVYDTMLACQIEENGTPLKRGWFTLESCVRRYVDRWAYSTQTYLGEPYVTKKVRDGFHKHEGDFSNEQILYGAKDTYYAYALYLKLGTNPVTDFENEFLIAAAEMELCGMPINPLKWEDIYVGNKEIEVSYTTKLKEYHDINWNSPQQIKPILKGMGFDLSMIDKKTGELKDTINAKVIEKYMSNPLIYSYLQYKYYQKMCSTYGLKFLKHRSPVTGRIHTSIHQLKDTGRTSSGDPNLQNIKKEGPFRGAFECPEGYSFVSSDYSNQELRVLAELADEKVMQEAFNTKVDIHLATARAAFNNPDLDREAPERSKAKTLNFGITYGSGASNLAKSTGVSIKDAKELIKKYLDGFPALKPYFDEWGDRFRELGYLMISDFTGRKFTPYYYKEYQWCKLNKSKHPAIENRYSYLGSKMQRTAQNYRIQGLAAEMSKRACVYMLEWTNVCQLALMVHDELIVICKDENVELAKAALKDCMQRAFYFYCKKVDISVDVTVSKVWKK